MPVSLDCLGEGSVSRVGDAVKERSVKVHVGHVHHCPEVHKDGDDRGYHILTHKVQRTLSHCIRHTHLRTRTQQGPEIKVTANQNVRGSRSDHLSRKGPTSELFYR